MVKATRATHTCSLPATPTCPVSTPLFPTHLCSLPGKKPPLCSLVSPTRTLRPSYKPPLPCSLPASWLRQLGLPLSTAAWAEQWDAWLRAGPVGSPLCTLVWHTMGPLEGGR